MSYKDNWTNKRWVVDIETMPDLDMIKNLPEPKPSKTIKDAVKIAADIEKKKEKQIAEMALNPLFAKIACIGMKSNTGEVRFLCDEDEGAMLEDFFKVIGEDTLITFNGMTFDIPFIVKRAVKFDKTLMEVKKVLTDRYNNSKHIDIKHEFDNYGDFTSLDTMSKCYLDEGKTEMDFTMIPELLKTPEGINSLFDYCMNDVELTSKLAEKFGYLNS